jgi:hypothetical protein
MGTCAAGKNNLRGLIKGAPELRRSQAPHARIDRSRAYRTIQRESQRTIGRQPAIGEPIGVSNLGERTFWTDARGRKPELQAYASRRLGLTREKAYSWIAHRLSSANSQRRDDWCQEIFMVETTQHGISAHGNILPQAMSGSGIEVVMRCPRRIRDTGTQGHMWARPIVMGNPQFQNRS